MSDKVGAVSPPPGVVPDFEHPEDIFWTVNIVSQTVAMVTITVFFSLRVFTKTFIAPPFCREDCKTRPKLRIFYQKLTVNRDVRRRMGIVYLMNFKTSNG